MKINNIKPEGVIYHECFTIREIIKQNNFQTPQEIMKFMKDSFKDILQEMFGAEMDVHLGYSRGEKPPANADNTRNGYSTKTVRS